MQQYFIEQAPSYAEAERKAREKYGEPLKILMQETVKIRGGFLNLFSSEGVKLTGLIPVRGRAGQVYETKPSPYPKPLTSTAVPLMKEKMKENLNFAGEKEKILATLANSVKENAGKEPAWKEVLAEVRTIKEKLESSGSPVSREEHPVLNRIDDLLILNDFSPAYRKTIMEKIRKEITLEGLNHYNAVQDKVLEWIGESLKIYETEKFKTRPRIVILVGPTGVGKTTTIAKLAANFGINEKGVHKRKVVLITIDEYRIGARQQIEGYSEVMEVPCFSTTDYSELKKIIAMNSEGIDLILVDTIGKNPRDIVQLGEMKQLLDACGTLAEVYLAVAATTKSSDLIEILGTFECFNYKSIIITKMDETIRTGNVIGALSEKGKPVSYITNGQKVPTDIRKASVIQFLINLEGFRVNRTKLEDKFPDNSQEQMQKWR